MDYLKFDGWDLKCPPILEWPKCKLFIFCLFSVMLFLFVSNLQNFSSYYLFLSIHDLNKSWLLSFESRAIQVSGLWRPLNFSSQTDDWLSIHSFFWKKCLIIILISAHPMRSCKVKSSRFCAPASQACQNLKGLPVTLWGCLSKNWEKKMNYIRPL